ncbi:Concanavalin A-like lectin/glucanase, subgroup [Phaffia rhodozyma]|uniref:Concanavalin A-like lectin/glucanase, subgroup n=1 Tax=Phaffia rhodozyma TaxID=264483 RepID=A0A0F7SQ50_PHARH|nr:Concanavalin A-like lectin/glucanase, subgroup [Phaffia rhodozyma]
MSYAFSHPGNAISSDYPVRRSSPPPFSSSSNQQTPMSSANPSMVHQPFYSLNDGDNTPGQSMVGLIPESHRTETLMDNRPYQTNGYSPASPASSDFQLGSPTGYPQGSISSFRSMQSSVLNTPLSGKPTISEKYTLPADPALWARSDSPEPDDYLHNPDPKRDHKNDNAGTILTVRGLWNLGCLLILGASLTMVSPLLVYCGALYAGYPLVTAFTKSDGTTLGAFNLGGVNGSGQVPQTIGNFGLIDKDTPKDAYTIKSNSGETWELQFSDEFNEDGRSFWAGDDPFWEALDLHAWSTNDLEYYDPRMVTTTNGTLELTLTTVDDPSLNHGLNYTGASIQSWNKFCFQGGRLEAKVRLPGKASIYGLWPAFWTMGNLGRVGYGGTLEGMWPYTYNTCDVGTLKNQTLNGLPSLAMTSGTDSSTDNVLSYLPGQRLSRCTCPNDKTHPGPKNSDGTWMGRSAPEIDVFEAQTSSVTQKGAVSQSAQWAPFNPHYIWDNATYAEITDPTITELNTYRGGTMQETSSGVSTTDQNCYQLTKDGQPGCYTVYAFEYKTGDDGYISWFNDDKLAWTYKEGGFAANADLGIGNRPIPYEPMYILFNLAMSYNFGGIDLDGLAEIWPVKMNVDYVRVYQDPNRKAIGCDPDDAPTSKYIALYDYAFTNENMTTWDQMTNNASKPGNSLLGEC